MENVCDLLVLGDEYQVAKVTKECRKFLMSATLDDQMAMKVFLLAKKCGLTDLRTKCCGQLSFIEPSRLEELVGFQNLDGDSMKEVLVPHLERAKKSSETLQTSLNEVLPQLVGLLELVVHLITKTEGYHLKMCPIHYDASGKANSAFKERLKSCTACKAMFKAIPTLACAYSYDRFQPRATYTSYKYGYDYHINEQIIKRLPKLMNL